MSEGKSGAGLPTIGLREALEMEQERIARSRPLRWGFPCLERMLRLSTGRFVILAARPGQWKTTLAWNWACNMAMLGRRVLWVGLEMLPGTMATMFQSRIANIARDDIDAWRRHLRLLADDQMQRLEAATDSMPPTIVFHQAGPKLSDILETANVIDYDAIFIDYVQLVVSGPTKDYERVSATSMSLAAHAHNRDRLVVALCQMNRDIDKVQGTGPQRMPTLSDLRGSGQLEQDADAVLFLHSGGFGADHDKTRPRVIVEKNRYGPGGIVPLRVQPTTAFIEEQPEDGDPQQELGETR